MGPQPCGDRTGAATARFEPVSKRRSSFLFRFLDRLKRRLFYCTRGKHRGFEILGVRCCSYCSWQESD